MDENQISVSPEAINDLAACLSASDTMDQFVAGFRDLVRLHGWHWFPLEPKRSFNYRASLIFRVFTSQRYANERRAELLDEGLPLWVLKSGGCSAHHDLDGITAPPSDPLWSIYAPPLDWDCDCYILGASSERAAERFGADLGKRLPQVETTIDPMWHGPGEPGVLAVIAAIVDGEYPPPP